jgi:hypothetical protein
MDDYVSFSGTKYEKGPNNKWVNHCAHRLRTVVKSDFSCGVGPPVSISYLSSSIVLTKDGVQRDAAA